VNDDMPTLRMSLHVAPVLSLDDVKDAPAVGRGGRDLTATLALLTQRGREARIRQLENEATHEVRLSRWHDWERAMPTSLSRSAVFAPIGRGKRLKHVNELIDSRPDVILTYTGTQLDMSDADVFLHLLELAKRQPLGTRFYANRAHFLRDIGRSYESVGQAGRRLNSIGEKQYQWLGESLLRLREASLTFVVKATQRRKESGGVLNLLGALFWDQEKNVYEFSIEPEIEKLFASFSRVYWERHLAIPKTDQLAKWMHFFVAGCEKNHETHIGLTYLRTYSGNKHRRMDHFETSMRRSLATLAASGIVSPTWFIRERDQMVSFTRIV
jgi:hypothetical protein